MATSVATEEQARELGIPVEEFSELTRLDIAIDGTDQVTPDGWLIKGGGGAHLREKIVAAAADRFVVISDSSKPVEALIGARAAGALRLRDRARRLPGSATGSSYATCRAAPTTDVIADYNGEVGDPAELSARLDADPGIAAHGLFPASMVSEVLIGRGERWRGRHPRRDHEERSRR